MFFNTPKQKSHPGLMLAVGALAALGAVSVFKCSKSWMCKKGEKMMSCVRDMVEPEKCSSGGE